MCKQDQPLVLLVQIQDDQDRVQVEMTKSFQVHIQWEKFAEILDLEQYNQDDRHLIHQILHSM